MANIARLGVVFGLDTAEFTQGLEAAKNSLNNFANKIPAVTATAVAALTAMTYKALDFADAIQDVATANNLTIDRKSTRLNSSHT